MNFVLRDEAAADIPAIDRLVKAAFLPLPYSSHTEQFMIRALRKGHALSISLVAESDSRLLGHVAFSPVTISDGSRHWYGLGPLAVAPEYQRHGIGQALVGRGLAMLRQRNASGCVVFGDPNYYGRFGFARDPGMIFAGAPAKLFQVLRLTGNLARGNVTYHDAFNATE